MQRQAVNSTDIASVGYDAAAKVLAVEFRRNGAVYVYDDVPESVYQGLLHAHSKGKFFHSQIKGQYAYRVVSEVKG